MVGVQLSTASEGGGGGGCRRGTFFSRTNRWRSRSVEICFTSPSRVAALKMWASRLFSPSSSKRRLTEERTNAAFKLMRSGCCFVFLFIPPPPSLSLFSTDTSSCLPFSLKPTLAAETYMPHDYATQSGVCLQPGWLSKRCSSCWQKSLMFVKESTAERPEEQSLDDVMERAFIQSQQ